MYSRSPLKANTSELRIVNTSLALAHSSNDKLTSKKLKRIKSHTLLEFIIMNENIIGKEGEGGEEG